MVFPLWKKITIFLKWWATLGHTVLIKADYNLHDSFIPRKHHEKNILCLYIRKVLDSDYYKKFSPT